MSTLTEQIEFKLNLIGFDAKTRIRLYNRLAQYVDAGINIYDAIREMAQEILARNPHNSLGKILQVWSERMTFDGNFARSAEGIVPDDEIVVLESGEVAGDLVAGLKQAEFIAGNKGKILKTVIFGSLYNIVLITMLVGITIMFSYVVLPKIEAVVPLAKWPTISKAFYGTAYFVRNYLWIFGIGLVILIVVISTTISKMPSQFRLKVLDKLPPWSVYKIMQVSSILISISGLMGSGKPFYDTLQILIENSPPYTRYFLEQIARRVAMSIYETDRREGQSEFGGIGDAFDVGFLTSEDEVDIKLMSKLGDFENTIYQMGVRVVEDSIERIQRMMKVMGVTILFFIVFYMMFAYYSIFSVVSMVGDISVM